ncbi:MAG: YggS family pyridoxal phosphate enzyme [Bacteroidia bacterium]|nr:MAG: YggS family pyridoxal phosphate enzyme [Bacteroidia bacterium]
MIAENLKLIQNKITALAQEYNVEPPKIIAVSKNHSIQSIQEAYACGIRDFGENRVQELISKVPHLPKDIKWHLIGNLQTNKVKYIAEFIHLIHSVDSEKLLKEIQKNALKYQRTLQVLIQINISSEPQKNGCSYEEAEQLLKILPHYPNVKVLGLMGIAEDTENKNIIFEQFKQLYDFFEKCKALENKQIQMKELSIGMSGDYDLAIKAHSTMIRIGTAIFGNRNY